MNFQNGRKILTLLTFGWPSDNIAGCSTSLLKYLEIYSDML